MTDLHSIAPRLAKARDERIEELRRERAERLAAAFRQIGVGMAEFAASVEKVTLALGKAFEPFAQRFAGMRVVEHPDMPRGVVGVVLPPDARHVNVTVTKHPLT